MYKKLENPESSHWHSPLLHDISFIKKHLHYPVNKKTIWPILSIVGIALWLVAVFAFIFVMSTDKIKRSGITMDMVGGMFAIVMFLSVFVVLMFRRAQDLKFISIKSNFSELDNIALIREFLVKQNIAFYHKSDAPEVFQISSNVLDIANGQREIMVFIADANRILLNSHFTVALADRPIKAYVTGAHKKMAADLKQWLKDNDKNYTHQFNLKKIGT